MTAVGGRTKEAAPPLGRADWHRLGWFAVAVVGVLVIIEAALLARTVALDPSWDFGMDARYYAGLGSTFVADGTFYLPRQLEGPYVAGLLQQAAVVDTLYPPSALFLFVPFAYLPLVLWWAIPLSVTGYVLWRHKPGPWAILVMLVLLAWPRAIGAFLFGNTDLWMMAGVAAGTVWGWPFLALTLKPTMAPLALLGARHRSWWVAAGLGLVTILLMLPLWSQYVTAMLNVRGLDLGYSLGSVPLLLVPLVVWATRRGR